MTELCSMRRTRPAEMSTRSTRTMQLQPRATPFSTAAARLSEVNCWCGRDFCVSSSEAVVSPIPDPRRIAARWALDFAGLFDSVHPTLFQYPIWKPVVQPARFLTETRQKIVRAPAAPGFSTPRAGQPAISNQARKVRKRPKIQRCCSRSWFPRLRTLLYE